MLTTLVCDISGSRGIALDISDSKMYLTDGLAGSPVEIRRPTFGCSGQQTLKELKAIDGIQLFQDPR
jgi:hypothetical protein